MDVASVIEAMSSGIFVFDRDRKLLLANREALRIFGFRSVEEARDELERGRCTVRVVNLDGTPHPDPTCRLLRALDGEVVTEEFERVEPLEGRWHVILRTWVRPIRDRDGAIVGVLKQVHDVTNEYELARRKEEFVRVTSHELRTPATTLRLAAQRIRAKEPLPPSVVRTAAAAIERATRRIETIATKLNDIATIAAGDRIVLERSPVHLDALVADVVESLGDEQSRRVHVTTTPATVSADSMRVREVIEALLDNALRFSPSNEPVEIDLEARDGVVEVSIADHGVGIPETEQPRVFEPFHRAHSGSALDRGGLGASLYLAAQIMMQHGGRIWFESKETRGSTFHLAFERAA